MLKTLNALLLQSLLRSLDYGVKGTIQRAYIVLPTISKYECVCVCVNL